ncbi:TonB-dependent receptor plug domain-containing protein [Cellvibrio fibrivorans]|uniref:Iron complex outermembrane receptor protein n=1 Tax=Cellvibrio fibrivorans TaxID=126350 RepID=A0ABU1UXS8_9GAMM|nr:TonB-dependent receptor [Cellvibrio fibrivorans]MDR7090000.1 iron complex outermembrane receptor protein [Cellvibrio fibrivorans]
MLRVIRLMLSGVVLVTQSVWANPGNLLDMNLEQLLQVDITSSTLRAESIKTVPSATTVFTRSQLDALGLDYLHELLSLVPGFQTSRAADGPFSYSFSIRGRRQSGQSREVMLLVDGRAFTDPRSGSIEGAIHLYPIANIEQVEIIRGPASAIYGSGAFTGVISITSRKQVNQVTLGVGENQKRNADINLSYQLGHWQTHFYGRLAQDSGQQYQIGSQTTRDPHREMLLDWNVQYRNSRIQAFYSEQEASDFYVLEKINNGFNNYWQTFKHLRFDHQLNPSENWKINLALSHEKAQQELMGTLLPAGALSVISTPSSDAPLLTKGVLASEAYRFNVANDLDINALLSMQFGMEWQHQREIKARSYNNYDLLQWVQREYPVNYYGELTSETVVGRERSRDLTGIYTQWLYQLRDDTRLTAGLRYDHYEFLEAHVSPRLGVVHQLDEHHTLKLLYSEAFRAPTFGETDLQNNQFLIGNPDLESETVKSSELLWVGTWKQLTLGMTLNHNQYEKPISTGFVGATRTYVNGAGQKIYGSGARFEWQLNSQWMLRGHVSKFHELPDAFFREADSLGSLGVNYQRDRWNWNLSAIYQGERQYQLTSSQRATLDSYWYFNTQVRYAVDAKTTLAFAIKNLSDKNYFTPSQGTGLVGGVPNRGREASIGLHWQW